MKCKQCENSDVVEGIRVVERGEKNVRGDLMLEVEVDPNALFFKEEISVPVSAAVCRSCGNVMFSLDQNVISEFLDAVEIANQHGDLWSHPRYPEFIEKDSYRKNMSNRDKVKAFSKWLRENESKD